MFPGDYSPSWDFYKLSMQITNCKKVEVPLRSIRIIAASQLIFVEELILQNSQVRVDSELSGYYFGCPDGITMADLSIL